MALPCLGWRATGGRPAFGGLLRLVGRDRVAFRDLTWNRLCRPRRRRSGTRSPSASCPAEAGGRGSVRACCCPGFDLFLPWSSVSGRDPVCRETPAPALAAGIGAWPGRPCRRRAGRGPSSPPRTSEPSGPSEATGRGLRFVCGFDLLGSACSAAQTSGCASA